MRERHITKTESVACQGTYTFTQSFLTLCWSFRTSASIKDLYASSSSSYSPSWLLRWRAARWSISLRGLPNSFGFQAARTEDSPPKSTICWLETEKAAGAQCLADWLRPSQEMWAALLNDTRTLVLLYEYTSYLSYPRPNPTKNAVSTSEGCGCLLFPCWVWWLCSTGHRELLFWSNTSVSACSDIKQQCRRKYFWWPSFSRVESRWCVFYRMQSCCKAC